MVVSLYVRQRSESKCVQDTAAGITILSARIQYQPTAAGSGSPLLHPQAPSAPRLPTSKSGAPLRVRPPPWPVVCGMRLPHLLQVELSRRQGPPKAEATFVPRKQRNNTRNMRAGWKSSRMMRNYGQIWGIAAHRFQTFRWADRMMLSELRTPRSSVHSWWSISLLTKCWTMLHRSCHFNRNRAVDLCEAGHQQEP